MYVKRKTISTNVSITGIGLHSGIYTKVELRPAASGSGLTFIRTDLGGLRIPALQASTTALDYATTVGKDDVSVGTVEHLLSALMACGVTDADIAIDGPEVPIVDGSALPSTIGTSGPSMWMSRSVMPQAMTADSRCSTVPTETSSRPTVVA